MFKFLRKRILIIHCIFLILVVTGCENSLDIVSTETYTSVSSESSGGSYAEGDTLEPGGSDAGNIAGVWMVTHKDSDDDNVIDLATDDFAPHSNIYRFEMLEEQYGYVFYSSPDATQEKVNTISTEWSYFNYSGQENTIYLIDDKDVITKVLTKVTRTVETNTDTGEFEDVMYLYTPTHGGYVRAVKQGSDYLPEGTQI